VTAGAAQRQESTAVLNVDEVTVEMWEAETDSGFWPYPFVHAREKMDNRDDD